MNKDELVAKGYEIFANFKRPVHFQTRIEEDPEAADHEQLLQARDRNTLALSDVASIGYNPISSITKEGMAYFMPRLIELALDMESISATEIEPYLWGFVIQIMPGSGWYRFGLFEKEHYCFVYRVLGAIGSEHMDYIKSQSFDNEFQQTQNAWRAECV